MRGACAVWQTDSGFLQKELKGVAVLVPSALRASSPGRCVPATAVPSVRARVSVCLYVTVNLSVYVTATETPAKSSLSQKCLRRPCFVAGTQVAGAYDAGIVISSFCFLRMIYLQFYGSERCASIAVFCLLTYFEGRK